MSFLYNSVNHDNGLSFYWKDGTFDEQMKESSSSLVHCTTIYVLKDTTAYLYKQKTR